jgi:hypothetical protein
LIFSTSIWRRDDITERDSGLQIEIETPKWVDVVCEQRTQCRPVARRCLSYDYDPAGWVKSQDFALLDDTNVKFFKPSDISQVVGEFKEKRAAIEAPVDGLANVDKSGAQSIKEQIGSFYRGLDKRFH